MKFGEFIREKRLKADLSLRKFCELVEVDPSNWSKIERNRMQLGVDREKLDRIANVLGLKQGDSDWSNFYDKAYIAQQKVPEEVYSDEELVNALPLIYRSARGDKPTEEELKALIETLRRR
jgi:transcriptional regulator with XRE-family HTH domain